MRRFEHLPPRYSRKPDPDEPWRYVCPDCEGQVQKSNGARYECGRCGAYHRKGRLLDRKTGEQAMFQ